MSETEKNYILTVRGGQGEPKGWESTLSSAPGVTLTAMNGRYAYLRGTPSAINAAAASLGEGVLLEEEMPRHL